MPLKNMRSPKLSATQELVRKGIASFLFPLGQALNCGGQEYLPITGNIEPVQQGQQASAGSKRCMLPQI